MSELRDKKIMVSGGAGFLGRFLVEKLRERGCSDVFVPLVEDFDLVRMEDVERAYNAANPAIVIHLAALVGGIGANSENPGPFFYNNLMMGVQMMEIGRRRCIEKFVALGTVCCYPKFTPVPFKEEDLWNGYPEESNAPYGLAKKMLLVQAQAYRRQYGFNAIFLMPVNLYGPGDNFNPRSSHVIPALIRRCLEAKELGHEELVVWGSGAASREFLYVEDCAEAIVLATEGYEKSEPVNIGAGFEITVRELAELIAGLIGFEGGISWDTSKPDGQPRRMLDVERAEREFGFKAKTTLTEGLTKTITWYLKEGREQPVERR